MVIPFSSRKRGRNPKESAPPDSKKKPKIEEDETGGDDSTTASTKRKTTVTKGSKTSTKLKDGIEPSEVKNQRKRKDGPGKSAEKKPRSRSKGPSKNKGKKKVDDEEDEEKVEDLNMKIGAKEEDFDEELAENVDPAWLASTSSDASAAPLEKLKRKVKSKARNRNSGSRLTGEAVPLEEARSRWPHRYTQVKEDGDLQARRHFISALVDGETLNLNDCCLIKAEKGKKDYIGRITELFETINKQPYIAVDWFFRAEDTVIKNRFDLIEDKRVFASVSKDDNPLDCIVKKVNVVQASSMVSDCDFYYDMSYNEDYCTFETLPIENQQGSSSSMLPSESCSKVFDSENSVMTLLDMYAGCGGMSTGLCMGAAASSVNLITRWAVDFSPEACQSLRHNHPETEVRHTSAEDFLALLKAWKKLCETYSLLEIPFSRSGVLPRADRSLEEAELDATSCPPADNSEFEVAKIVGICYGDPNKTKKGIALHYKVSWKGWDPTRTRGGLLLDYKCEDCIKDFVIDGYKRHILPLPGTVDIVCGGCRAKASAASTGTVNG